MRTVFPNSQVVHLFANQHASEARNSGRTVRCEPASAWAREGNATLVGPVLWSYATPIAAWHAMPDGSRAVLRYHKNYSSTTAGHFPSSRDYPPGTREFRVPFVGLDGGWSPRVPRELRGQVHAANVAAMLKDYNDAMAALLRAPAESWRLRDLEPDDELGADQNPTRAHAELRGHFAEIGAYAEAFRVPVTLPNWRDDAAKAIARRDRLLNDPKRAEKKAKAAAQRDARELRVREELGLPATASNWEVKSAKRNALWEKQRAERAEREAKAAAEFPLRLAEWRAGTLSTYALDVPPNVTSAGDLMRVSADGRTLETSRGASVPLSYVRPALAFYLRSMRDGLTYSRRKALDADAHAAPVKLGEFTLEAIHADGRAVVGCHSFNAEEVALLVAALGVTANDSMRAADYLKG